MWTRSGAGTATTFWVAYRGDAEALRGVLEGRCEVLEQPEPEFGAAYSSLKLHVERDADVREVIARINDAVELRSFTEIIPSMNDIFIRAVGEPSTRSNRKKTNKQK